MLLLYLLVKVPAMTTSSPLIIGHLFDAVIICRAYWKKMPYYDPSKNKPQGLYFSKPPFERPIFVWREIWAINLMGGFLHLGRGVSPRFFSSWIFLTRSTIRAPGTGQPSQQNLSFACLILSYSVHPHK